MECTVRIGANGQCNLPRMFCELKDRVVITNESNDDGRYLLLLSPRGWNQLVADLRKRQRLWPEMIEGKTAASFYLEAARERKIDRRGRITIPPPLRDFAGLKRDAVMLSRLYDYEQIQLWEAETHRRCYEAAMASLLDLMPKA